VRKFTLILTLFIFPLQILLFKTRVVYATVYFQDSFSDNDMSNWEIKHIQPSDPYWPNYNWSLNNGWYGISLSSKEMHTYSVAGNADWNNYIFKFKMIGKAGNDKNIIFRYKDENNWYGFHMRSDGAFFGMKINGVYHDQYMTNFPFINNVEYNMEIDIQNNTFSFYVNNQLIVNNYLMTNYYFGENPIKNGKIALYVSAGETIPSEVWFDNVIVCSLDDPCELSEPKPTKTIFIPGLGASFSFKGMFLGDQNADDWGLTPGVNSYNNLFTAFEGDTGFYTFYYDWRKSILENAQKLNAFIESKISPGEKVNLVGHSLGGLVGRACIEKQNGCHADKLITAGSPFLGVLDVYPAAAAGEIWKKGPEKLAFELLTHYLQRPGETSKETLAREAPVIKELLPKFDYLIQNGSFLPWSSQEIKSNLVFTENASVTGKIQTLVGNNQPTLKSFTVLPPNWLDNLLGYWPDGKAQSPGNFAPEGDGTVLTQSAKINLSNQDHEFTLNHGELVYNQNALNEIFTLLGKTLPAKTYPAIDNVENYLVFAAHSPIKLFSPQASASSQLHDELIIIPNPQKEAYDLQLQGTDNGSWRLSVGQIYGNQTIWNDYVGQIGLGSTENLIFDIRPNAPLENPLVNSKDMILQAVDDLKAGADEFLSYYLDKILAQLNSQPSKTLFYARLFRDAVNFYQKSGKLSESIVADLFTKIDYLDSLLNAFVLSSSPNYSSDQALEKITLAEAAKAFAENQIDTKAGGLVYLLANQRLKQAKSSPDPNQQYLYSSQAQYLFLHAKLIK